MTTAGFLGLVAICTAVVVLVFLAFVSVVPRTERTSLAAKRFNERLRYFTSALNTMAVGIVAGAVFIPSIAGSELTWGSLVWFFVGFILHSSGQVLLGLIRPEDEDD